MMQRLFAWVVAGLLMVGVVDTAWAVRNSRMLRHGSASTKKALLRESLALPRGGRLPFTDGPYPFEELPAGSVRQRRLGCVYCHLRTDA